MKRGKVLTEQDEPLYEVYETFAKKKIKNKENSNNPSSKIMKFEDFKAKIN